ncbi:MAG: tetratricopeptide repeat protein [Anaerolineae bacterium]|nr:tetratricopeptide repeat protein [Anaerolineae bacterium]
MDAGSRPSGRTEVDDLLRAGIRHAKTGAHARARALLERALDLDEGRVEGWLWLSAVVEGAEEKAICLENVLALDPGHAAAQRGLAKLHAQAWPTPTATPPVVVPSAAPPPLWPEPPDPLLCPYCASMTRDRDRRCPACGRDLWIRMRRRDSHSAWLWNLIGARFSIGLLSALAPVVILAFLAQRLVGALDPFVLLPAYVGLPSRAAPGVVRAALGMVPPLYLLPFVVLSVYSFALAVGMYVRWSPVYWLLIAGAAVRFGLSISGVVIGGYYGLLCGGAGVLASIGGFLILLAVEDDFRWDRQRVYLRLDRRSRKGTAWLERAALFADLGMWALAVLHLRAAAAKMPTRTPVYVRLARAYLEMERPDLARATLRDAARIDAHDPIVGELLAELEA